MWIVVVKWLKNSGKLGADCMLFNSTLTVDGAGAEASGWRVTPMRPWISSLLSPLLSRKDIFLSVDALRTSSSSRNFLACSITASRLGD
jgi:hypothetical protein